MSLAFFLMGLLLFISSLFLILIVLVQRGRGGGLTGALGGMGGQSAFGAKAGDTFTRITIVTAIIWILLCMVTIKVFNPPPPPKPPNEGMSSGASEMLDESGDGALDELDGLQGELPGAIDDIAPAMAPGDTPAGDIPATGDIPPADDGTPPTTIPDDPGDGDGDGEPPANDGAGNEDG